MAVPSTRKSRLEWLADKRGIDYVMSMYTLTDREVKKHFEQVYPIYKDYPSYSRKNEQPKCLVCQSEARITWECECGVNEGIFDEDDPQLSERQQAWKERV